MSFLWGKKIKLRQKSFLLCEFPLICNVFKQLQPFLGLNNLGKNLKCLEFFTGKIEALKLMQDSVNGRDCKNSQKFGLKENLFQVIWRDLFCELEHIKTQDLPRGKNLI